MKKQNPKINMSWWESIKDKFIVTGKCLYDNILKSSNIGYLEKIVGLVYCASNLFESGTTEINMRFLS